MNEVLQFATPIAMIILLVMQGRAASKVEQVKTTLQKSGNKRDEKLTEIHELVNDRMTRALDKIDRLEAQLARLKLARRTRTK
jgi:hypothetical protein